MFVLPIKQWSRDYWPIKDLPGDKRKKRKNISDCNLYNTDNGFGVVYKILPLGQNMELKRSEIQTNKNKLARRGH